MLKTWITALVFWNIAIVSALGQFPGGGPPDGGPMPPPPDQQEAPPAPNPKQFLNRLSKTLKLSDDQKAQIKPILDSEARQLDELRKTTNSMDEKLQRIGSIEDKAWAAIRPLLNQTQQKKFDALTKKMQERRERAFRQGNDDMPMPPDGPPPGPPPGESGPPPFE